jgi:hypothetical protein
MAMSPDQDAADEIREALTHLAATAARIPLHWTDRKKALHDTINDRLDELELVEGWLKQNQ